MIFRSMPLRCPHRIYHDVGAELKMACPDDNTSRAEKDLGIIASTVCVFEQVPPRE